LVVTNNKKCIHAYDTDGCVKDLTKKYAGHWLSCSRRLRLDEAWWRDVLQQYAVRNSAMDDSENRHIHAQLLRKSLPATIGEFKNHPLYALRRHLLKFQAIYPRNAPILGSVRGEPIYARENVYKLHSTDRWLVEGRLIRPGEKPYNIVQSRPTSVGLHLLALSVCLSLCLSVSVWLSGGGTSYQAWRETLQHCTVTAYLGRSAPSSSVCLSDCLSVCLAGCLVEGRVVRHGEKPYNIVQSRPTSVGLSVCLSVCVSGWWRDELSGLERSLTTLYSHGLPR